MTYGGTLWQNRDIKKELKRKGWFLFPNQRNVEIKFKEKNKK
jgi:hypothetical protein